MSWVIDHLKGLEKETVVFSFLHSWIRAYLTPSNALQEDQRCSGSSSAEDLTDVKHANIVNYNLREVAKSGVSALTAVAVEAKFVVLRDKILELS